MLSDVNDVNYVQISDRNGHTHTHPQHYCGIRPYKQRRGLSCTNKRGLGEPEEGGDCLLEEGWMTRL